MARSSRSPRYKADCANCNLKGGGCVPGYGAQNPYIMFIAEAPGEQEVNLGKPLIGRSGQFLRMVIKDLGIDEAECYFTNVCICKPPSNRKPKAKETAACMPRLLREISRVKPRFIMSLGGTPGTALMKLRGITYSHGTYRKLRFKSGFEVGALATYHPSGVLRGPDFFIDFVEELERAKNIVDLKEPPVVEPPYENYEVIDTQERYESFLIELHAQAMVAVDLETDGMDWFGSKIMCAGFSWKRSTAHIVDWEVLLEGNLLNIRALDDALKGVKLSFHNGLYDVPFFWVYGIFNVDYYFDTMLAHYLIDERRGTHGLEHLTMRYYHSPDYKSAFRKKIGLRGHAKDVLFKNKIRNVSKHDLFMYNGADVDYTFRLTKDLAKLCKADGQLEILRDIEMPTARTCLDFTWEGLPVDQQYWRHMAAGWRKEIKALEVELRAYPDVGDMNFGSAKQVAHYLFDVLGLLPFGGKKSFKSTRIPEGIISEAIGKIDDPEAREYWTTKRTGMNQGLKGSGGEATGLSPRSTSTYMLYFLKQQHSFPAIFIQYKILMKRYSMYWDGIKKFMWGDGRIHPKYKLTGTRTGRKASEEPAIHNLPRGDEIYNIYVAPPGWVNIHADYMSAEMRMMAHYSKVKKLQVLLDTSDIHTTVAKEIFSKTDEEWDAVDKNEQKNMRIAAKMLCMTPDQRVLTAKLKWKPVGELVVGEQLIAFDEEAPGYQNRRRHWLVSTVTSIERAKAAVYDVYLSDGTVIRTTAEHLWLTRGVKDKGSFGGTRWVQTSELRCGGGPKATHLPRILPVWEEAKGKLAGYIQGVLDSEGSLSKTGKELGFTQQPNRVLTKMLGALEQFGVATKNYPHHRGHDTTRSVRIAGGFAKILECLGRFRPVRLLHNLLAGNMPTFTLPDRDSDQWVRIVRVKLVPRNQEIVRLATTSQTLFGEGFPMHNSFGIPYGRSAKGIAPQLGISVVEAAAYQEAFLELTGLKPWLTKSRALAVKRQYAISAYGRKRRFPFIRDKYHRKEVERQAGNMPIQSAINDMTLIAWFTSIARLKAVGIPAKPWPHIHDSLNIIVPTMLWRPAVKLINEVMQEIPFETHMTFPAELEVGPRWGGMITVLKNNKWDEDGIVELGKVLGGIA